MPIKSPNLNNYMREKKFRAYTGNNWLYFTLQQLTDNYSAILENIELKHWCQYTGLKDKNGNEIYELMEINNKYRVIYKAPCYVLQDISTGDIINIYEQNKLEITREYSPLEEN